MGTPREGTRKSLIGKEGELGEGLAGVRRGQISPAIFLFGT